MATASAAKITLPPRPAGTGGLNESAVNNLEVAIKYKHQAKHVHAERRRAKTAEDPPAARRRVVIDETGNRTPRDHQHAQVQAEQVAAVQVCRHRLDDGQSVGG